MTVPSRPATAPGDVPVVLRERWVKLTRWLDAPPHRVFYAWTDPSELSEWFPDRVEGSLAVGAESILTWHDRRIPIQVVEAESPRVFRFRWRWLADGSYISEVRVRFDPRGYGTLVTLTDGAFDLLQDGVLEAYEEALAGWSEALANLRARVDFSVDLRHEPS